MCHGHTGRTENNFCELVLSWDLGIELSSPGWHGQGFYLLLSICLAHSSASLKDFPCLAIILQTQQKTAGTCI